MAVAAHASTLKVSGTAVAVTDEATTDLTGGVFQVTNTARHVWDPSAAITVEDDGVIVAAAEWTFNYLEGKVTFATYVPAAAVTINGSYLPLLAVAEVRDLGFSFKRTLLEKTTYDSAGWRECIAGLLEGDGTIELLSGPLADVDSGPGGIQSFLSYLIAGTPKLLEISRAGTFIRGWVVLEAIDDKAAVADLITTTLNWKASSRGATASFAFIS